VETRLRAIKEKVEYPWQIYFLYQFIPLVHLLLSVRMYDSDEYLAHNVNCVGLTDSDPVRPSSMG